MHTTCQYKIPHARAPGVQGASVFVTLRRDKSLAPLQKNTGFALSGFFIAGGNFKTDSKRD